MCAIAGILGPELDNQQIQQILKTMHRRGPDGNGSYRFLNLTLLHTRLAIIDPIGGVQPMELEWSQEHYVLTYNGELYNTQQLRRELQQQGHRFQTSSDTEVVLHAYVQWKEKALEKMNGIFAFAVWEQKAKRLFLARDRIGVKPLFYIHRPDLFAFASEIKTLLALPEVPSQLDAYGAAQILLLGPGRIPGSGVFRNIYEVEPGQYGIYEKGILSLRRYWKLQDHPHTDSFSDTVENVRTLVTDSIQRQMVSDVPIGTFLSGGLDSSIITAVCSERYRNAGKILPTFSLDYANQDRYFKPSKFQPNSDTEYIRLMEREFQNQSNWTVLSPVQLFEALEDATVARDLPGMADVDFSLLVFCRQIRNHVKVALSGECADEIFGGYPWFRDPAIRDADGFPWAQSLPQRVELLPQWLLRKIDPMEFVQSLYHDSIAAADVSPDADPVDRRMKQMMALNIQWFMQTLLDRKDRMSMFSGLEVRVPFCDHRIAEYLYTVPWEFKDHKGREKGLLRCAMEGILPDEILYRKKSPYPKTHDPAYLELVSAGLMEVLSDPHSPILDLIPAKSLQQLLEQDFTWPWYGQLMRRPQTIAYMLQINFWLKHYKITII